MSRLMKLLAFTISDRYQCIKSTPLTMTKVKVFTQSFILCDVIGTIECV